MIRFADPWWLALVPLAFVLVWQRSKRARRPTVLFSSLAALKGLPRTLAQRLKRGLPVLEILGILCLILALARPQAGRVDVNSITEGVAIGLIVDRSGSMDADDLDDDQWDRRRVRRIDIVKTVVKDFADLGGDLPGRPNDLLGLVSFCGYVQTHCPLTLDHEAFVRLVDAIDLPEIRRKANGELDQRDQEVTSTALGDGLFSAVEQLREVPAKSKVAVLLSDGVGTVGVSSPEAAAQSAKEAGIKLYTVAIGQRGGDVDEATLERMAKETGGQHFHASTASEVRKIYGEIDRLERSELTSFRTTQWDDHFPPLLWSGIGVLVLHWLLSSTRFRTLP